MWKPISENDHLITHTYDAQTTGRIRPLNVLYPAFTAG